MSWYSQFQILCYNKFRRVNYLFQGTSVYINCISRLEVLICCNSREKETTFTSHLAPCPAKAQATVRWALDHPGRKSSVPRQAHRDHQTRRRNCARGLPPQQRLEGFFLDSFWTPAREPHRGTRIGTHVALRGTSFILCGDRLLSTCILRGCVFPSPQKLWVIFYLPNFESIILFEPINYTVAPLPPLFFSSGHPELNNRPMARRTRTELLRPELTTTS